MHAVIRSLWNEPRPPDPPVRVPRDWVLVGVLVPVALLEGVLRPDLPHRVVAVTLTLVLLPTLLWRRTHPLRMLLIVFAATALAPLLTGGASSEAYSLVYVLILVYALARWGSGREIAIGLAAMITATGLSTAFGRMEPSDVVGSFAVMSAATTLGIALRYRARARSRELDQVKLLERAQLARDLHDTVAHHVSAMAIRAQAGLATSASRPDAATEALKVIEEEAALALAEMNSMVRVLRQNQPPELAPGRGVADLAELATQGSAVPAVKVHLPGDLGELPTSVGAALYRLAQESVTNARRHARHVGLIEVSVSAEEDCVRLSVTDDGSPPAAPRPGSGYGIIGMIERAELLGGTCQAGPGPERGWTVTAVLPRAGRRS
ncbi:sensor histidine kinase [Nonomuraea sp. NPDC050394]|uniref:sensor histidine kinase n=1 Tax=Nonomuraea sp. NPDC050394 TaxID=3364363 RepID=UPI0037A5B5B1